MHFVLAVSQLAVGRLQVLNVGKESSLAAILNIDAFEEGDYLVMLTKNGLIKRTPLSAFTAVRPSGLTAIKLKVG
jgi:DNA gyrase subunit A